MSAESKPPTTPAVNPDIDEQLHGWWNQYGKTALAVCGLALAFYLGRVGWAAWQAREQTTLGQEFAQLKTPDQWRRFAADHPHDVLAGLAELKIGDDAYDAGQVATAQSAYEDAATLLKGDPLQVRARLGSAMAMLLGGQTSAAELILKAIFDDTTQLPVARCQAGYELAALENGRGHSDQAQKIAMQLLSIAPDPMNNPWVRRAFMLRPAGK